MGMECRLTLHHSIKAWIEEPASAHAMAEVTHCYGSWPAGRALYYVVGTSSCRRGSNYEGIDHIKAIHVHISHCQTPFCNSSIRVAASSLNCSTESDNTNSRRA